MTITIENFIKDYGLAKLDTRGGGNHSPTLFQGMKDDVMQANIVYLSKNKKVALAIGTSVEDSDKWRVNIEVMISRSTLVVHQEITEKAMSAELRIREIEPPLKDHILHASLVPDY